MNNWVQENKLCHILDFFKNMTMIDPACPSTGIDIFFHNFNYRVG